MFKSLTFYMNINSLDFKCRRSTVQTIIDLQSNIIQAIKKKHKACSIILDFLKVFDTMNH